MRHVDVLVAKSVAVDRVALPRRRQLDAGAVGRPVRLARPAPCARAATSSSKRAPRGDGVDQAPVDRLLALDAFGPWWRTRRPGRGARGACRPPGSSPPVPGSTASSGTSGSDTAEDRSSISRISSHARASS